MASEIDLSCSSEPSSQSHSQESQRRKCKYQGKVSTWIIFNTVQKNADLIQNTVIIEQYAQLLGFLNSSLPVFFSKLHPNPKNKNNAGELRGSDGADQAKGS